MFEILLNFPFYFPAAAPVFQHQNLLQIAQLQDTNSPFDSAEAAYNQAVTFHQDGKIDESIQAYQEAIRLDPQFDAPYINLSLLFISIGGLDEANNLLQRVLELPDRAEFPASIHALAHYNLAIIRMRQEDPAAALAEVQLALEIDPNFSQAHQLFEQLQD